MLAFSLLLESEHDDYCYEDDNKDQFTQSLCHFYYIVSVEMAKLKLLLFCLAARVYPELLP